MKRIIIIACLLLGLMVRIERVFGQSFEVQQLLLNVEKLAQFKQNLQNLKKSYQILEGGYNNIRDISQGNFKLHKVFLDGLLQVSPEVRRYKRVAEILQLQRAILRECSTADERFLGEENLTAVEARHIVSVYGNVLKQSARNMEQFLAVMTAGKLRMSDAERIESIDRIYSELQDMHGFLRHFGGEASLLVIQRRKQGNEIEKMRKLYGREKR